MSSTVTPLQGTVSTGIASIQVLAQPASRRLGLDVSMSRHAGGDRGARGRPRGGTSTRWTQRRYDRAVEIEPGRGKRTDLEIDGRGRLRLVRSGAGYAGRGRFESAPYRSPAGRARLDWIEQWTAPQRFVKHRANPIYGPADSGPWDTWTNGVSIVPCAEGSRYRMYYAGRKERGSASPRRRPTTR